MRHRIVMTCLVLVALTAPGWAFNAQDLLKDLSEETGIKQYEAALRLGEFNYPEVIEALSKKLADENSEATVRAACVQSLGELNDASTYPMIEAFAKKPEEKGVVRSACVKAMATMKGDAVIVDLAEMLKTEKATLVRKTIETTLSEMKDKDRVTLTVAPLLKDDETAPSAIRIMGTLGGPGAIVPLAEQLGSPKASIRMAVISALGDTRQPAAAGALLKFYPNAKNDAEKARILKVFENHPHPEVIKLLLSVMQDGKAYAALRRRAALTLGTLHPAEAVKPLVDIMLNTTEHSGLRMTCVQALGNYGDRDDYAIAGLIGALDDKRLQGTAAISLNRITNRYFGPSKDRWAEWFKKWRAERDRNPNAGY